MLVCSFYSFTQKEQEKKNDMINMRPCWPSEEEGKGKNYFNPTVLYSTREVTA